MCGERLRVLSSGYVQDERYSDNRTRRRSRYGLGVHGNPLLSMCVMGFQGFSVWTAFTAEAKILALNKS